MSDDIFKIDENVQEELPSKYLIIDKEEDFIQDGVFIKDIEIDPEGRYFSIIATKDGKELQTQRQYFPERERARSEETFKKAASIKQALLTNILRKFKGEDATLTATSWIDLVTKVRDICKPYFESTPLRVKLELVQNKGKYYTNISTFAPFELMSVERKDTNHKITEKDRQMLKNKLTDATATPDVDPGDTAKDDQPF